ncbi:MAG TPA: CHAT domain-containing protein, partial [Candidatus Obscuribacterales bacterium]
ANLGQYQEAIALYEQRLVIAREIGDRRGEGAALGNLGNAYRNVGQYQEAIALYEQQLVITREIGDRQGEGSALGNLGVAYNSLGQPEQALEQQQQALIVAQDIGDRSSEGLWLSNMGALLADQDQPELAIVFYKQSVNVRESIRDDIQGLSQEQQQSFTETIASSYRRLADLLLAQNRILEAQEVLDLLKLQELQDYELQDVRGTADTRLGLDLWDAEQAILDRFFTQLSIDPQFDFNTFITSPDIVANVQQLQQNARGQNLNPAQLVRLQDNLQQAGNAALLYPLILDDRLELVLVTPDGLINETVPVDRLTLNAAIVGFRQDITDRFSDPRANAQQLYEWLMQPIVDDLDAAGVDTILYAADGALRYIPIAALHDGNQWLTERFTINHITAASLTDFTQQSANDLNILAGAFPEQDVYVDLGTEQVWFSGLPFAQEEVQNLVSLVPQTTAFFDQDFNRSAIETRLNDNYTIIHLATHAEFRSGHPTDSFILLGDGDRLTVADLNRWQLPDVDLVVLSACKTAVSSELGDGAEILGFGYQMQQTGADAAIASLWYVSDGGTQALMDAFYTVLANGLSESEALRRSQQALITSDESVLAGDRGNPATIEIVDGRTGQPLAASTDLAHPYYWAPFILIGNGL